MVGVAASVCSLQDRQSARASQRVRWGNEATQVNRAESRCRQQSSGKVDSPFRYAQVCVSFVFERCCACALLCAARVDAPCAATLQFNRVVSRLGNSHGAGDSWLSGVLCMQAEFVAIWFRFASSHLQDMVCAAAMGSRVARRRLDASARRFVLSHRHAPSNQAATATAHVAPAWIPCRGHAMNLEECRACRQWLSARAAHIEKSAWLPFA